jgi:diguanylate cyclase (GGDEF)-like protein
MQPMKSLFSNKYSQKHVRINLILIITTLVIIVVTMIITRNMLLREDRRVTTNLVFDILHHTMDQEFDRPLQATRTMESDSFLRTFLEQEEQVPSEEFSATMGKYLAGISRGNSWSGAYFSSARTMNYYDVNGFAKVIDPEKDPYDLWYTKFIESGNDYDIDVEYDQLNADIWTVFLDKRMEDESGKLLGVCTVGMQVGAVQETMHALASNYGIDIFFTEADGTVVVSSGDKRKVIDYVRGKDSAPGQKSYETSNSYTIVEYIPLLDWFLVVENSHNVFASVFQTITAILFGVVLIMIAAIVLINIRISSITEISLTNKAETDVLTNILNREGLRSRIKSFIEADGSSDVGGTMFMVDLDHLKTVNDTMGHSVGDETLVHAAEVLKQCFRNNDIIGRLGGDEFIVFTPGITAMDLIIKKAEMMNSLGMHRVEKDGVKADVSFSIGIAIYPMHSNTYDDLYKKADKALYAAKEGGRNMYKIYNGQ